MKLLLYPALIFLMLSLTHLETAHASKDPIHAEKAKIMEEEYLMVRQMRHKLRYLLEQQDAENTLQEGEDVFQDLQQLEQWLEEMKRNPENANLEAPMQMLQQLEQRMNKNLTTPEQTQQWLDSGNSPK